MATRSTTSTKAEVHDKLQSTGNYITYTLGNTGTGADYNTYQEVFDFLRRTEVEGIGTDNYWKRGVKIDVLSDIYTDQPLDISDINCVVYIDMNNYTLYSEMLDSTATVFINCDGGSQSFTWQSGKIVNKAFQDGNSTYNELGIIYNKDIQFSSMQFTDWQHFFYMEAINQSMHVEVNGCITNAPTGDGCDWSHYEFYGPVEVYFRGTNTLNNYINTTGYGIALGERSKATLANTINFNFCKYGMYTNVDVGYGFISSDANTNFNNCDIDRFRSAIGKWSIGKDGYRNEAYGIYDTIAGGYINQIDSWSDYNFIGSGRQNKILAKSTTGDYNFIGSGHTNELSGASYCGIATGYLNDLNNSSYSFVGGGQTNAIDVSNHSFIGGGQINVIDGGTSSTANFIGGGNNNTILGAGSQIQYQTIVGGQDNQLSGYLWYASIVGGYGNSILAESSSDFAFIGGGSDNTITDGSDSVIAGGSSNTMNDSGSAVIIGGAQNNLDASGYGFIGCGRNNSITNSGSYTIVVGGRYNEGTGIFNFIGGGGGTSTGIGNKIYAGTNGSIVGGASNILSGGNYNFIGGGQLNITKSPWSFIGGGGWNTIDDSCDSSTIAGGSEHWMTYNSTDAFIGGGSDNELSGGYQSVIVGGRRHQIRETGGESFIGGGSSNYIWGSNNNFIGGGSSNKLFETGNNTSGYYSAIVGGDSNISDAHYSFIGGGGNNIIGTDADHSSIVGGYYGYTTVYGQQAYASGRFSTTGDAQTSEYVLRDNFTAATSGTLTTNNLAAGTTNQLVLQDYQTVAFKGQVVIRTQGATPSTAVYDIDGLINRDSGVGTTTLIDSNVTARYDDIAGDALTLEADTTNGCLKIEYLGVVGTNIRIVANLDTVEVIYPA